MKTEKRFNLKESSSEFDVHWKKAYQMVGTKFVWIFKITYKSSKTQCSGWKVKSVTRYQIPGLLGCKGWAATVQSGTPVDQYSSYCLLCLQKITCYYQVTTWIYRLHCSWHVVLSLGYQTIPVFQARALQVQHLMQYSVGLNQRSVPIVFSVL